MEIGELKTLLKFQNVQLEESPPAMKTVKPVKGASKFVQKPITTNIIKLTGNKASSKKMNVKDLDRSTEWKLLDLGEGNLVHLPVQETRYSSSESLSTDGASSSTMQSESSSLPSSDNDTISIKSSLRSFSEIRAPYQRTTYVSCLKKIDSKTQTLTQMLQKIPKLNEQEIHCTSKEKDENVEDAEDKQNIDNSPSVPPQPQTTNTEDIKQNIDSFSDEDIEYSGEDESEDTDVEVEDPIEMASDVNAYERAKEIVRKITGQMPESEGGGEEGEEEEDETEEEKELTVFHFRPNRDAVRNVSPQRRRGGYAMSQRTVLVEKTLAAIEAAASAEKAAESLLRAQPHFRDISPMARLLQNTSG